MEERPMKLEKTTKVAYDASLRDLKGPLTVDQIIRQAIQHCWMILPEEERSIERVEQEIFRLVLRALRDAQEDALAFGCSQPGKEKQPSAEERLARIRAKHPKAYEKWPEEEDELLRLKFQEGAKLEELSRVFQRQPSAIRSRLRKLGLTSATQQGQPQAPDG
jgi:flagellar motility protein MotE (MotC chaperone)